MLAAPLEVLFERVSRFPPFCHHRHHHQPPLCLSVASPDAHGGGASSLLGARPRRSYGVQSTSVWIDLHRLHASLQLWARRMKANAYLRLHANKCRTWLRLSNCKCFFFVLFFCTSAELLATSYRRKLVRFKETRLERKNVYPNAVIISANVDSASEERNFIGNLFQNKAVCQGIPRIWLRRSSFLSSGGDHWLGLMWRSQWQWAREINSVICF